jgi:hypothetical protein
MPLNSCKPYNTLNFKERFVQFLHNELSFSCVVELKTDEFHTCPECQKRANSILRFLTYELGYVRQQQI